MSAPPFALALRRPINLYIAGLVALATGTLGWRLIVDTPFHQRDIALAFGLSACMVLAFLRPLNFAFRTQVNLETTVLVAGLLLLRPGPAMLVAAIGGSIAWAIQRRTLLEILFNAAQFVLQGAAGALALASIGWHAQESSFHWPDPVIGTLLAGLAMFAVNTLAVAGMIGLEDRIPFAPIWFEMTFRASRAELLTHLAQMGIGLLTAIVADAEPWALGLLGLPAIAIYLSLEQHVDMRRRAEENLEAAQKLVRLGSWDWDLRNGDQRWSGELYSILGLAPKPSVASAEHYLGVVHPDDRKAVEAVLGAAASSGIPYAIDHRIMPGDGEPERIIHARGEVFPGRNGKPARVIGTVLDITERKRLEQRLQHQAEHDPLTDLPNRAYFTAQLDETLRRAGNRARIAVLYLDLDRFKLINDTFGHDAGDQLLIAVADRLRRSVRPGDIVARLGGDEFTILLGQVANEDEAIRVAQRIIDEITEPIDLLDARELVVSTSIGIVVPGPGQKTGVDLVRDADNALYRAKERGRNQFALFDATMGAATRERVALEADLRKAMERDQFRLLYQPKIDLASGRTVAVEALLRWEHPTRGLVPPSDFVPIAEEIGMIRQIGRWVLRQACAEAATWGDGGLAAPSLNVNLSGKQLHDPQLATELEALLAEVGLPPERLRFEIRETVAMTNADATIGALWRLHRLGVRAVIDDFGTGVSSLPSLQRFPVDTLQLDHSFVANLGKNRDTTEIAHALIGLAHTLGLKVVAEGVERRDQLDHLRQLGCEQAQGHFFSEPLVVGDLHRFLERAPINPGVLGIDIAPADYA